MKPVSIIMSVYNESENIDKAIVSIQRQDYLDWELIIVDDASLDDSYAVISRFAENDERIKPIGNPRNIGLAASLNRALAESKGELVARMDGDDQCLPNRLGLQVSFLNQNPMIDVLGAGSIDFDEAGKLLGETCVRELHDDLVANLYKENPFIHATVMARRRFFTELGGYDESLRRAQDYDLWLRGYKKYRYHNLRTPLIYYRRRLKPNFRNAFYSSYVLWRSALSEGKIFSCGWFAMRPLVATALAIIKEKKEYHFE